MVQTQTSKARMIPIRLPEVQVNKIDEIVDTFGYKSRTDFIREAIEHYVKEVELVKVIKIRAISREEAKSEIREYLKSRDKAWLDEIADDLRLDFAFVVEIIEELEREGFVKDV
ncbi:MAG: ribbon-helix-helix protein, CopG family [Methanophagales archaeon]|nr:ribbon-helix-helix protein, CopG family [Methanophagales archaeon]